MSAVSELERGREAFAGRAWSAAYEALSRADQLAALEAHDLGSLAVAAYMLGRVRELSGDQAIGALSV